ncbi:MAG: CPBP family intramembrane metalloprotease [Gemmataceae bacterium]|nr:CPBP family intramembrane metalloprotease [Gemmataceae bacterium]
MPDAPTPPTDPPPVTRAEDVPLVVRPKPRPGLVGAALYTLAYAVVVFGTIVAVVVGAAVVLAASGNKDALKPPEGASGPAGSLPPVLAEVCGYAVIGAYAVGLAFTLLVLRLVVGRGWVREVGLDRLPAGHLALAVVAFPAFSVGSDLLARLVTLVFGPDPFQEDAARALSDMYRGFHWSVAVLAIGVCPGVAEELWCRGFLGRGLVGRYGPWAGVLFTSAFFGLLHAWPPAYVFLTAVMGAALHFSYLMSRSLWVPITIHLLNNSLAALGAIGLLPESVGAGVKDPSAGLVGLTVGGLIASGSAMWAARCPGRRGPAVAAGLVAAVLSGLLVRELWP